MTIQDCSLLDILAVSGKVCESSRLTYWIPAFAGMTWFEHGVTFQMTPAPAPLQHRIRRGEMRYLRRAAESGSAGGRSTVEYPNRTSEDATSPGARFCSQGPGWLR